MQNPYTIVLTGVESSGKTTLARALAAYYQTAWVAEYAREYLQTLNTASYTIEDVERIAKEQRRRQRQAIDHANQFLFCDTDVLVCKIWTEVKYGRATDWIQTAWERERPHLYILCDIDIMWEYDPLRETPDTTQRIELFNLYKQTLEKSRRNYIVASGSVAQRVETVRQQLQTLFNPQTSINLTI